MKFSGKNRSFLSRKTIIPLDLAPKALLFSPFGLAPKAPVSSPLDLRIRILARAPLDPAFKVFASSLLGLAVLFLPVSFHPPIRAAQMQERMVGQEESGKEGKQAAQGEHERPVQPGGEREREEQEASGVKEPGWRATRYDIDLTLDPGKQYLHEKVRIDLESDSEIYSLNFLLNENLHLLGVKPSRGVLEYRKAGEVLMIDIDPPVMGRCSITFDVEGKIKQKPGAERPAFSHDSVLLLPSDYWYPLAREGWARSLIKATLPAGFRVVCPGKIVDAKQTDQQVTFTWQNGIPTPLLTLIADKRWIVRNAESGSAKIQTCLYPSEEGEFAERIASSATDIINYFSTLFCPNPYDQISFVELEGLRHSRTLNGIILYSPEDLMDIYSSDGFDARHIGYLWWGHLIGGKGTGGREWMQGLGSYAEHLACEKMRFALTDFMKRNEIEFLLLDSRQDRPFSEAGPDSPEALLHGKGPAILGMLRYITGDEAFFKAIKKLFKERLFTALSLEELRATLEEGTGTDLERFFKSWIYSSGVPELRMEHRVRETHQKEFRVDVKIVQEGGVYQLPVEVLMAGREERKVETVAISGRENEFFFKYPFKPENVILDPSYKIFRKRADLKEKSLRLVWKQDVERAIHDAMSLERMKKYDDAAKVYEEALKSVSNSRELLYNYARMEQTRKNHEKALVLYASAEKAEALLKEGENDPLLPWIHIRKGNIHDLAGRRSKALKEYRKALDFPNLIDSKKVAEKYLKEPYAER